MILRNEIRPSSEIDAYCTKCRMVTNHRVVAMMDGVVKRVICLTCDGQHNFRPPPGQKKTSSARARRITKDKKRVRTDDSKAFQQWVDLKEAMDPEAEIRPYVLSETYSQGEAVNHSKFGLGFVNKILGPGKIEIMFEKELKTLVMNYKI